MNFQKEQNYVIVTRGLCSTSHRTNFNPTIAMGMKSRNNELRPDSKLPASSLSCNTTLSTMGDETKTSEEHPLQNGTYRQRSINVKDGDMGAFPAIFLES